MQVYTITKDFTFSAAHRLEGLIEGHKCARMHGHNYVVRVELSSERLNEAGFVVDYGDLSPFGEWIDSTLDHRCLNEVFDFQPSAELMAEYLVEVLRICCRLPNTCTVRVGVSETPKVWACFAGPATISKVN